jgi:hypothetical protein
MESDNTDNELTDELTDEQQESVAGGGGLEGQGGWRSANRPWIVTVVNANAVAHPSRAPAW